MGTSHSSLFSKYYDAGSRIGSGTFAIVKSCARRSDKSEWAVKIIYKNRLTSEELCKLKNEINILQTMNKHNHPHIIRLQDVFENGRKVKIVMELCQQKNLLDIIYESPNHRLDETKCAKIVHTMAKTIKYLHDRNIVHRDIKCENILFAKDGTLKIADFGFSKQYETDVIESEFAMKTASGTPLYVAPEILAGDGYSHMVDLWSLGVILYVCLCGYHPFSSYANIMNGVYKFPAPLWDDIDADAMDLVAKLLTVDADKRISCEAVMAHKWIFKHVILPQFKVYKRPKDDTSDDESDSSDSTVYYKVNKRPMDDSSDDEVYGAEDNESER